MIGTRVSHYQIQKKLGEGGMGVVYQAEDIRLGRGVALKFLSERSVGQGPANERFQREARLASSLNHPNICSVYDIGEDQGQFFIVMELLEGGTLHELVGTNPLPAEQILEIGIQIASALEAAHSKGIIHRDIKPANIFVTPEAQVKVVDFGLAKPAPSGIVPSDTQSETLAISHQHLTSAGAALGTVEFMSPEQASGLELDGRSDLFAFGAVLYYMATGQLPFRGNTAAVVFSAILDKDPQPPIQLNPALPEPLQSVILKALQKDPEHRYQSAREMRADLRRLLHVSRSGSVAAIPKPPAAPGARLFRRLVWAATPLLVALLIAGYWYWSRSRAAAPFARITLRRLTDSGRASQVSISPDGRYVVYVDESSGRPALWLRQVEGGTAVQILPPEDVDYGGTIFSPDGNSIYFVRYRPNSPLPGEIFQMPVLGGRPRLIVSDVIGPPAFSPDSRRMVFVRNAPDGEQQIVLSNSDGSGQSVLVSHSRRKGAGNFADIYGGRTVSPAWSSDGRTIAAGVLYTHAGLLASVNAGILEIDVATGKSNLRAVKNHSVGRLAWLPGKNHLLVTGWDVGTHDLRGQISVFDVDSGNLRRVTEDLSNYSLRDLSVVERGDALVAVEERSEAHLWVAREGDFGHAVEITAGSRSWEHGFALLGDGRILADDSEFNLAIMNRDGSSPQPFMRDPHAQWAPAACGQGAAFVRFLTMEESEIWRADLDDVHARRLASGVLGNPACTPDGQWVVWNSPDPTGRPSLWKVPAAGGQPVQLLASRSFPSAVSPDGAQVAVVLEDAAPAPARHFALVPLAGGEPRLVARNVEFAGSYLRWAPDGRALIYVLTRHGISNIWRQPLDGGPATQLTDFTSGVISDFNWSPNGDAWFARGPVSRDVVLIRTAK